ncbi:hypothetical protein HBH70_150420 [Parastagonospora nodorum]|nr:hypothetical protein HBI09_036910 [Parastagonospora nodorum]KAH4201160.1 hypothetical protein HBH42_025540 [Parastagonospora nodorum]KAH5000064.1 hypothetical protein HBI77_163620 [Parastagonospora nodorum]KAH5041331.1 hypothetical protein HBI75_047770 [Parastagonospora nodorum]KAH5133823.1 hypothetical protein HBH70_150420 [Parastagonospora nodorum]
MDQLSAKPDGTPSPQVRIAFLDMFRLWLFFAIPIYARAYLSTSLLVVTCHFPLMGACALCLARFNGKDRIGLIWDVAYCLLASILPFWAHSVCRIFWFGPDFNSWRLDVLYWMFVLRKLVYLLPEQYGSDVELLIPEYEQASHPFSRLGTEMAATFVGWVLWPRGCPWYHVLLIFSIVRSVLEYLQFAYMNHTHIQKHGKTVRQDNWPYKDLYTSKWATDEQGNRTNRINHTAKEWLLYLSTGSIHGRTHV